MNCDSGFLGATVSVTLPSGFSVGLLVCQLPACLTVAMQQTPGGDTSSPGIVFLSQKPYWAVCSHGCLVGKLCPLEKTLDGWS